MNRVKFVAVFATALSGIVLCLGVAGDAAAKEAPPQPSRGIVKQLKAAQDATKAGKYDEAIAQLKQAQSASGQKTAYDNFVINAMLGAAYAHEHDNGDAAPALQAAALSQYATPDQQLSWLRAVTIIYYQQKDYAKTLQVGELAMKHGANDQDMYVIMAQSQDQLGRYREAAETIQQVIAREPKPEEQQLGFQYNAYLHANDRADATKVMEKLVTYYPKPDYWLNALAPLLHMNISDAHLQLDVYRLMSDVGVLKQAPDYAEMADLALDQGFPGETVSVLEKAFAQHVFTEQRDTQRYQHLLDGAKQRAVKDEAQLPAQEQQAMQAANGDPLVAVGAAYLSYGQPDKAATLLAMGIAKGGLKYPEDATLLLGIAQLRSHNAAEAERSFDKVAASSNQGYAQLGKFWALHAQSHAA